MICFYIFSGIAAQSVYFVFYFGLSFQWLCTGLNVIIYEGGSKSLRKSAAKFVIVMGNLRSLCML